MMLHESSGTETNQSGQFCEIRRTKSYLGWLWGSSNATRGEGPITTGYPNWEEAGFGSFNVVVNRILKVAR